MNKVKTLLRKLSTLGNCSCGSASIIMLPNGKQKCMDCGNEW